MNQPAITRQMKFSSKFAKSVGLMSLAQLQTSESLGVYNLHEITSHQAVLKTFPVTQWQIY